MPGVTMHLKVWKDIENATIEGVHDAADILAREISRLVLDTPKTGRVYEIHGAKHQASAPGQPYADLTGATLASVRVEKTADRARVILGGENALRLETGTPRMAPRPVMEPAYRNVREEMLKAAGFPIRRYLRKFG